MKILLQILIGGILLSCNSDDSEIINNPLTDGLVELGVNYGPDDRQFLDIYKAESSCPTPIYFDAHGNGGTTSMPSSIIEDLNAKGITVIAWESLTSVNTPEEVETGWSDAELMFSWVSQNADKYNLDPSQLIIGGSSRGSILSWKFGHSGLPEVKGLYMYNALPNSVWVLPDWWLPTNEITADSPPIFFVYNREPGSSNDPVDPDGHDPVNGTTIVDQYKDLGLGDQATLVHSIGASENTDKYQFLIEFALSVLETCQ